MMKKKHEKIDSYDNRQPSQKFIPATFSCINKNNKDIYLCNRITLSHRMYYRLSESFNKIYDQEMFIIFDILEFRPFSKCIRQSRRSFIMQEDLSMDTDNLTDLMVCMTSNCSTMLHRSKFISTCLFVFLLFYTQYLVVLMKSGLKERILFLLIKNKLIFLILYYLQYG